MINANDPDLIAVRGKRREVTSTMVQNAELKKQNRIIPIWLQRQTAQHAFLMGQVRQGAALPCGYGGTILWGGNLGLFGGATRARCPYCGR